VMRHPLGRLNPPGMDWGACRVASPGVCPTGAVFVWAHPVRERLADTTTRVFQSIATLEAKLRSERNHRRNGRTRHAKGGMLGDVEDFARSCSLYRSPIAVFFSKLISHPGIATPKVIVAGVAENI
jgi:hypothetical protein